MKIRRKSCSATVRMLNSNLVLKYVWITIPHLSVCLPTLKLTTFEQQVCSIKMDYANAPSLGGTAEKKKKVTALNSVSKAKKQCNFGSGWLTAGNLKTNLKGSIFKNNNQINSTATTRAWGFST